MLIGGAYQDRNIPAQAQRCVNLYAEQNPQESDPPVPVTYYPTPGLSLVAQLPWSGKVRCVYRASNGKGYAVVGPLVLSINNSWGIKQIGSIPDGTSPVSMIDNGMCVAVVDGTASGWVIDLVDNQFGGILDTGFSGSRRAEYLDTYFVFAQPNARRLYISLSNATWGMMNQSAAFTGTITPGSGYTDGLYTGIDLTGGTGTGCVANITVSGGVVTVVSITDGGKNYLIGDQLTGTISGGGSGFKWTITGMQPAFYGLDFANKTGFSDNIQTVVSVHKELWLLGELTTEIWVDTGSSDFALQPVLGAFVDHGCAAPYSATTIGTSLFWLAQDRQGKCLVAMSEGYNASRISTNNIEAEFQNYNRISDAIGFAFQIQGHYFYCLTFPTAGHTWLYDWKTKQWSEWNSIDDNGILGQHRANCCTFLNNEVVIGDWDNGKLYKLDVNAFTDAGNEIIRIRTFPHMIKDGKRMSYQRFVADLVAGLTNGTTDTLPPTASSPWSTGWNNGFGFGSFSTLPGEYQAPPYIMLRYSDDRGTTYCSSIQQDMGATGRYLRQIQWWKLGMGRDRVFEISWSAPVNTALNGAFLDVIEHKT